MKTLRTLATLAVCLLATVTIPVTQGAEPAADDNIYNYLQLFRSDLNSAKVEIVNQVMKLTEAEARKFWPIYRNYENELSKLAVARAELIAEFVTAHQAASFDDAKAKDMARRWFSGQKARLQLLKKYHGKIQKSLSPVRAGQFLQIENQIAIFIDTAIASEMPAVGQTGR